ncbi:MAG TPA: RidA family protein [Chthoniobacteraceae bacterium]|jgi:enamine deaminase RidA (YjgF/YER057c/UK114 family)|nr:RidA family protein [Chthoniobacteraceae bacterium]
MTIEEKLTAMHLQLPAVPPKGKLRPAIRIGNIVRTSGQTSPQTGKVGRDLTTEQGHDAARDAILRALTAVKGVVGDLAKVKRIVHVLGLVNAAENYYDMPLVIHGATDLLLELWGDDAGWHTRSAIGVYQLPANAAVEIELTVEVEG